MEPMMGRSSGALVGAAVALVVATATPGGRARAGDKEAARAWAEKGAAAYALTHYAAAADSFEKAFEAQPDPALLFNAAQAHRLAGNNERALALYHSYLRLPGKLPKRAEVEKRIAELTSAQPAPTTKATATTTKATIPPPTDCPTGRTQIDFEAPALNGIEVAHGSGRAFSAAQRDTARVWCGRGSARVTASFNLEGARTSAGHLPFQLGELYLPLPAAVDLTNRTLTAHVFVDGPAGGMVGGQVAAWNHDHLVDGTQFQNQAMGRWLTFTHTFGATNRLYVGGTSRADQVDGLVVQVWAAGTKEQRVWSGTVYVDDVGWR
jgi:hypothetical protein